MVYISLSWPESFRKIIGIPMVFETMARKHWTKYLPEMTADLKKSGEFDQAVKEAADQAKEELSILVSNGAQLAAAKEIVLKEYILLPPEHPEEIRIYDTPPNETGAAYSLPKIKEDQLKRYNELLDKAEEANNRGDYDEAERLLDKADAMEATWDKPEQTEHPEEIRIYGTPTISDEPTGGKVRGVAQSIGNYALNAGIIQSLGESDGAELPPEDILKLIEALTEQIKAADERVARLQAENISKDEKISQLEEEKLARQMQKDEAAAPRRKGLKKLEPQRVMTKAELDAEFDILGQKLRAILIPHGTPKT